MDAEFRKLLSATSESALQSTRMKSEHDVEKEMFFMAVQAGNNRSVYKYLLNSADPDATDERGRCALHMAALGGHQDVFSTLLNHKANPNKCDNDDITPLMCAAQKGSPVMIDHLLALENVDVAKKNKTGLSAVFYALKNGHLDIAKKLEEKKSCINDLEEEPRGAIWEKAVGKNWDKIAEFLEEKQCTLSRKNKLVMACKAGLGGHTKMLQYFKDVNFDEKLEDGRSPLRGAVQNGYEDAIRYMLDNGCDVSKNEECVQVAIITGRLSTLKLLLDHGAPLYEKDEHDVTPIQLAVIQGSSEMVEYLMERGCNLNESHPRLGPIALLAATKKKVGVLRHLCKNKDAVDIVHKESGETPLLAAAQEGPIEAVKLLIEANCNMNAKNRRGVTPALRAAHCKQEGILRLLGDNGADLDIPNRIGETAILCAARVKSFSMVRYLYSKQCNLKAKDVNGRTIAYYAAESDNAELIRFLEKNEVPLDEPDAKGMTPIMIAVKHKSLNCMKHMISSLKQCDIQHRDYRGRSVASVAVEEGNLEFLKLLKNKADFHVIDSKGNTLLLEALQRKECSWETVQYLVEYKGADQSVFDLQATNDQLNGAVHYACENENNDCLMLLLEAKVPFDTGNLLLMTPFMISCQLGLESIMMVLKAVNADVSKRNIRGENAAHLAVKLQNKKIGLKILHCLSLFGCALDQEDKNGITPLMLACERSNVEMVRFLIRKGADVNAVTHQGRNPFHFVSKSKSLELLELLADNHADCNAPDLKLVTPLMLAAKFQGEKFLEFFKERNCDLSAKNSSGRSALHYAVKNKDQSAAKFLLQAGLDPSEPDNEEVSPLLLCVQLDRHDILKELTAKGGKLEFGSNKDGYNAAHFASKAGNLDVLKDLPDLLNSYTDNEETCLTIATSAGHENVVRYLLEKNFNPNSENKNKDSCLTLAAKHRHLNLILLLLEREVEINHVNNDGDSALHILCRTPCSSKLDKVETLQNETGEQLDQLQQQLTKKIPGEMGTGLKRMLDQTRQLPQKLLNQKLKHSEVSKKKLKKAIKQLLKSGARVNEKNGSGLTPLHLACATGSKTIVSLLFQHSADPIEIEVKDSNEETPLFQAVRNEREKIVQLLLEKNAAPREKNKFGQMPILFAAANNNKKIIDQLSRYSETFDIKAREGVRFFRTIFKHHDTQLLDLLIKNGFDVTEIEDGSSILHCLVSLGDNRLLEHVLKEYSSLSNVIDQQDKDGDTAFNLALMRSRLDLAHSLYAYKCKTLVPNKKGHTALHVAVIENKFEPVKWLYERFYINFQPQDPDTDSPNPLQLAAIKGNMKVMKLLLSKGFKPAAKCKAGNTAAHYAAIHGNLHIVEDLFTSDREIFSVENKEQLIPFECAVLSGQLNVAKFLLEHNKNWCLRPHLMHLPLQAGNQRMVQWLRELNLKELDLQESRLPIEVENKNNGESSFRMAITGGNFHLAKLLLPEEGVRMQVLESTNNHGSTAAQVAAFANRRHLLRWLHQLKAPMNKCDKDGDTPLLEAAIHGHIDILKQLHSYGCIIQICNKRGRNVAHLGSLGGHLKVVRFAQENNIALDDEDRFKCTPLMYACHIGSLEVVKFLIDKKCKVNKSNGEGITSAHVAAKHGHAKILHELFAAGANAQATDKRNTTPLMVAVHFKQLECAKLLIDKMGDQMNSDATNNAGLSIASLGAASSVEMQNLLTSSGINLPEDSQRPQDDAVFKDLDVSHREDPQTRQPREPAAISPIIDNRNRDCGSGQVGAHPALNHEPEENEDGNSELEEEDEENAMENRGEEMDEDPLERLTRQVRLQHQEHNDEDQSERPTPCAQQ